MSTNDAPDDFDLRIQQRERTRMTSMTKLAEQPRGNLPNTILTVATISFLLGATVCFGLFTALVGGQYWWMTPQLGFFVAAWGIFHFGEFATTAGWNPEKCCVDSFVLDNGSTYHIANSIALVEYLITLYFWPSIKTHYGISAFGMILTCVGQVLRSTAMIHAASNFSHLIAYQKASHHVLVTDGVYGWFRHPSYAGFYYWALGTQLALQNPVTFVGFAIVLWRFFSNRIRYEESTLLRFFADEYPQYKQRVRTWIPLV